MAVKGGVIVETDKAYEIGVYNASGKLIKVIKVSGKGFIKWRLSNLKTSSPL
ncbi:MAG: hypothetical protein ABIL50_02350 [candidate division WOR-3 bacterium]